LRRVKTDLVSILSAWEFDRDVDASVAEQVVHEHLDSPDLEVLHLSSAGDRVTVQVVEGAVQDPRSVLFVEGRGLHEILRLEGWPPLTPGGEARVLLTLRRLSKN
jgi:hypothetical protein